MGEKPLSDKILGRFDQNRLGNACRQESGFVNHAGIVFPNRSVARRFEGAPERCADFEPRSGEEGDWHARSAD